MPYVSTPRLVFAGQALADPSTVNNDPEHFGARTFRPQYPQFGALRIHDGAGQAGSCFDAFPQSVIESTIESKPDATKSG